MSERERDAVSESRRRDRGRARSWLLQIHYRWESEGSENSLQEVLDEMLSTRRIGERRVPYIRCIVKILDTHLPEIDRALATALDNWQLKRLSSTDRAALRIAGAEMLFLDDVPPKVSIQEGIRLAEQYGGEDSARFVNGVLDALYKEGAPGGVSD